MPAEKINTFCASWTANSLPQVSSFASNFRNALELKLIRVYPRWLAQGRAMIFAMPASSSSMPSPGPCGT